MSRVGRKPIAIVPGVKVQKTEQTVKVTGPKGELSALVHPAIGFEVKGDQILSPAGPMKKSRGHSMASGAP